MEASERRILPLPKRRVTSGTTLAVTPDTSVQTITPNILFSRLHSLNNEVNSINQALSNPPRDLYGDDFDLGNTSRLVARPEDPVEIEESEDDDDDECTGCRDWLENAKNKKKRKIPTSAVMGHTASISSPVQQVHGTSPYLGRAATKAKTRRRRTWDVSSEARPDASLMTSRMGVSHNVFPDTPKKQDRFLSTDFDFTCDSPVARNLPAPLPEAITIPTAEPVSIATQTSPSLATMEPILPPRHRRTKEEREYDRQRLLAKQRREARSKLKPGEKEKVWICQFCEYESIFGYAPLALIHGYNERIRTARRAALERKRLLEKARSKGKKKKKLPSKATAISPTSSQQRISGAHNLSKTGIDKSIGPGGTSCSCCDHLRDREDREKRHREHTRPAPPPPLVSQQRQQHQVQHQHVHGHDHGRTMLSLKHIEDDHSGTHADVTHL